VEKSSQGRWKVADDARPGAEVAVTIVKRLLCRGFRHTGKDGTSVSVLVKDMSRNKCFLSVPVSHFLRFIYICGLFT
jgi:hypothetical protein